MLPAEEKGEIKKKNLSITAKQLMIILMEIVMVMSKIILLKTCLKKIPNLGGLWPMILMQGSLSCPVQLVDDIKTN